MKLKHLTQAAEQTYVLVFETGDEVMSTLTALAAERNLVGTHFTGLGAFQDVVLGYFNWTRKGYDRIPLGEQVEVLSLIGDITAGERTPQVHAHVVVGRADGTAHGGHLLEAHVRPTLEVVLVATAAHLKRVHDPESGLALIDPDA